MAEQQNQNSLSAGNISNNQQIAAAGKKAPGRQFQPEPQPGGNSAQHVDLGVVTPTNTPRPAAATSQSSTPFSSNPSSPAIGEFERLMKMRQSKPAQDQTQNKPQPQSPPISSFPDSPAPAVETVQKDDKAPLEPKSLSEGKSDQPPNDDNDDKKEIDKSESKLTSNPDPEIAVSKKNDNLEALLGIPPEVKTDAREDSVLAIEKSDTQKLISSVDKKDLSRNIQDEPREEIKSSSQDQTKIDQKNLAETLETGVKSEISKQSKKEGGFGTETKIEKESEISSKDNNLESLLGITSEMKKAAQSDLLTKEIDNNKSDDSIEKIISNSEKKKVSEVKPPSKDSQAPKEAEPTALAKKTDIKEGARAKSESEESIAAPILDPLAKEATWLQTEPRVIPKPEASETIVIHDKKPKETDIEEQMVTIEPSVTEGQQAGAEARGLMGLVHRFQKKWNDHILQNKQLAESQKPEGKRRRLEKKGKRHIEEQETPQHQIKKAAQESIARDVELKRVKEAQKIYERGLATIKDLISPSSMVIEYDHLQVSGIYSQSFFVYAYPRYLEVNWLSDIVNSDITMDISMFIYPVDSAGILKRLRNKSAQIGSSIAINQEKGNVRDPQLETALEDVEDLRDRLMRSEERFFQFGLYFTIYSEDRTKLIKLSKQIESTLGGQLIFTKRADMRIEQGFNSSLPQATDELGAVQNMNTGPLSTSFPFISNELSDDHGILYGLNRHNDTLIIFDRFSLENANSIVLATSGAGKSYAVKLEILRSLMLGSDVIVIDPENEYESLCEAVGGIYLKVSMDSDQRINPFDLPKPFAGEDNESGKALRQNVISLTGLLHLMLGDLTPNEEAILDQAILDTYALKGIMMDTPDPGEKEPPIMSDLYDVLISMKGGEPLAQRLSKYTIGSFGGIFNQQTNVDMGRGMIVFCIRDLDETLRPMAMYVILNYIWNLVRSELRKRIMVVDEAWTMMQYPDSARFLAGLTRRARKYFLGITTITQNVNDFIGSSEGRTVITNSAMQLLLKQSPAAIDQLTEVFHLTEGEKYTLLNSDKGQGIFFAGLQHVAIQIIASYGEHQLITTNPEEVLEKKEKDKRERQLQEKTDTNLQ